jgi:hypothetical protein
LRNDYKAMVRDVAILQAAHAGMSNDLKAKINDLAAFNKRLLDAEKSVERIKKAF